MQYKIVNKLILPNFYKFNSRSKTTSPLDKFYLWILEETHPMANMLYGKNEHLLSRLNVDRICLNNEDYGKLTLYCENWLKNNLKITQSTIDYELSMMMLFWSPRMDINGTKKGEVTLLEGWINNE